MKRLLLSIPVYLTLCFTSCGQKNCSPTDYNSIDWQPIDSTTSFYLCSNSDTKLTSADLVDIEYLGTLQKGDKIIIQKEDDKAFLSLFLNAKFGQVKFGDTTLPKDILYVINQLTKKSEATLKFSFGNIRPVLFDKKVTVYFKSGTDSTTATKFVNEIKVKPYVDSTYYLSNDAATAGFTKDLNDSTWLKFLDANPIPASVEIFIKQSYFDTIFIRKLGEELMKSNIVSEVQQPNNLAKENLKVLNQIFTNTYLVRVRPKE